MPRLSPTALARYYAGVRGSHQAFPAIPSGPSDGGCRNGKYALTAITTNRSSMTRIFGDPALTNAAGEASWMSRNVVSVVRVRACGWARSAWTRLLGLRDDPDLQDADPET